MIARSGALHLIDSSATWGEAGWFGAGLRAAGVTVQSTDLLIAVVAMQAGAVLVHRDSDFDAIARHAPLLVESHV